MRVSSLAAILHSFLLLQYLDSIKQSSGDWNEERGMLLSLASYQADLLQLLLFLLH